MQYDVLVIVTGEVWKDAHRSQKTTFGSQVSSSIIGLILGIKLKTVRTTQQAFLPTDISLALKVILNVTFHNKLKPGSKVNYCKNEFQKFLLNVTIYYVLNKAVKYPKT